MPLDINIIAILVAMVANFIIQMVWYTALFQNHGAKKWATIPTCVLTKKQC